MKTLRGFTLIELLVVIAIISLLSSIVFASLSQARAKARDSKRIQDLKQVQIALELYRSNTGLYPDFVEPTNPGFNVPYGVNCWDCTGVYLDIYGDPSRLDVALATYLNPRPTDPSIFSMSDDSSSYWYKVNPGRTEYKMGIIDRVENPNSMSATLLAA